jgi:tyrosine aminotransferase
MSDWKTITPSIESQRTINKIRLVVDQLDLKNINHDKPLINLSLGDPACYGNLDPGKFVTDSVIKVIESNKWNGYTHSWGIPTARKAIAAKYSVPNCKLTENDVIIASACSGAIEIAIAGLANEGDNILLPKPGFGIYETIAGSKGIVSKFYNLDPKKDWDIDLEHLESLIDSKTKVIVVNNPSNPCGSVYSREHLVAICKIAEKHRLPIIADEVYANMTFSGKVFVPMASCTETVPILTCGGLAKQYLVPGWRVGWILIFDRNGLFKEVREGLGRLTTLILGANTLIQAAIPDILNEPKDYFSKVTSLLESHAIYAYEHVNKIKGLKMIKPYGAMYGMIEIDIKLFQDHVSNDIEFTKLILKEESILLLPGSCFAVENFVRVVLVAPEDKLKDAFKRMEEFCKRHMK